jgi:hypothetical protein
MDESHARRQRFRLRAVRRTVRWHSAVRDRRVADEEIVHALWSERALLEARLSELAHGQDPRIASVSLVGVNDADGVLVEFHFALTPDGPLESLPDISPSVIAAAADVLERQLGTEVAVSASPEPPKIEDTAQKGPATPWTQIAPVLAAIGTGIGVIGFVTFIGGAVVWARLNAAGFPAAPALGVFPSQDLLVIGAETLVPQVIVALVTVLALALSYYLAVGAARLVHRRSADWLQSQAQGLPSGESSAAMFVFIVTALGLMLLWFRDDLSGQQFLIAIGLVVVSALIAAAVGRSTRPFVYLAATTFVLVGVFESYVAYARESSDEKVRGAAVIRDNKKAVVGLFVAEGSERLYLARVSDEGSDEIDIARSRLVGIAKDEVTDVAIADRKPIAEATLQAVSLAKELCELQPRVTPAAGTTVEDCRTAPPGFPQP